MKRRAVSVGLLLFLFLLGTGGWTYYSDGPGPGPGQPYMENALSALQQARQQLVQAAPDKGGHRVQANWMPNCTWLMA